MEIPRLLTVTGSAVWAHSRSVTPSPHPASLVPQRQPSAKSPGLQTRKTRGQWLRVRTAVRQYTYLAGTEGSFKQNPPFCLEGSFLSIYPTFTVALFKHKSAQITSLEYPQLLDCTPTCMYAADFNMANSHVNI